MRALLALRCVLGMSLLFVASCADEAHDGKIPLTIIPNNVASTPHAVTPQPVAPVVGAPLPAEPLTASIGMPTPLVPAQFTPAANLPSSANICRGPNAHRWTRVGARPYEGMADQALLASGWPAAVQKLFIEKIRTGEKGETTVRSGDCFDWMVFGKPNPRGQAIVERPVLASWKAGETHRADVYTVTWGGREYKLYQVADCGNWTGTSHQIAQSSMRVVAAPPVQSGPCPSYLFRVNLWDYSKLPADLRRRVDEMIEYERSQGSYNPTGPSLSRSLGAELRTRSARGEFPRANIETRVLLSLVDPNATGASVSRERYLASTAQTLRGGMLEQVVDINQVRTHTIRVVFPDDHLKYPLKPSEGGFKEMRFFPAEWGNYCIQNTHAVIGS